MSEADGAQGRAFPERLAQALAKQGLTKNRLAKLVGLSATHVGHLVSGGRAPTDEVIERIAPHLGVGVPELKALAEVDRLGPEGLEALRQHWLPQSQGEAGGLARATLTRFLKARREGKKGAHHKLAQELNRALGGLGLAWWRVGAVAGQPQIVEAAGLPAEYVLLANLAAKGGPEALALVGPTACHSGQAQEAKHLLSQEHPEAFLARSIACDAVVAWPVMEGQQGALAIYLPEAPTVPLGEVKGWLALAAEAIAEI